MPHVTYTTPTLNRPELQALRERVEATLRRRSVAWPDYEAEALLSLAHACDHLDAMLARKEHDAEAG